jgi:DNA-binding NarL/FixJ family response regulator
MALAEALPRPERTTVVIVDDNIDMRVLLRLQFDGDARFQVVGEAEDGDEAIVLAGRTSPDLMILDRQMPRLGGVEAIPQIRRVSPGTAIVLYTAGADANTYHAALAAGALDVIDKSGGGAGGFVEHLAQVLLSRSAPDATIEVRVGPIPTTAARVWVANTKRIIEAVAAHPDIAPTVPEDVIELFRTLLAQWGDLAEEGDEFRWVARAAPADVSHIVEAWAHIDAMTDEQLDRLGIHWSPPEGEPFFRELTAGVLQALSRHDETQRLAAKLGEQWAYLDET